MILDKVDKKVRQAVTKRGRGARGRASQSFNDLFMFQHMFQPFQT